MAGDSSPHTPLTRSRSRSQLAHGSPASMALPEPSLKSSAKAMAGAASPHTPLTRSRSRNLASPVSMALPEPSLKSSVKVPASSRKGKRSQKTVSDAPAPSSPSISSTSLSLPSPAISSTPAPLPPADAPASALESLEAEFEHEDMEALAAAISDNLQARLRQQDAGATDSIRAIFEHTTTKRPDSYGAFVLEKGVVQLGPLPEAHDSRNVIASIANNNKVTAPAPAAEQPKIYSVPTTRAVTTGAKWFDMKTPEITPEIKTDLAIIANRAYLDPKRFYKKEGTKKLPAHFQIGTVVAGAHEFYSSLSHKERSKNYVEEIYKDDTTKSYLKRKYNQIQATKSMKGHTKKKFFRGKKRGK